MGKTYLFILGFALFIVYAYSIETQVDEVDGKEVIYEVENDNIVRCRMQGRKVVTGPKKICKGHAWPKKSYLRPHRSCRKFWSCTAAGVPIEMDCPSGLHWDKKRRICNWPKLAKCHGSGGGDDSDSDSSSSSGSDSNECGCSGSNSSESPESPECTEAPPTEPPCSCGSDSSESSESNSNSCENHHHHHHNNHHHHHHHHNNDEEVQIDEGNDAVDGGEHPHEAPEPNPVDGEEQPQVGPKPVEDVEQPQVIPGNVENVEQPQVIPGNVEEEVVPEVEVEPRETDEDSTVPQV